MLKIFLSLLFVSFLILFITPKGAYAQTVIPKTPNEINKLFLKPNLNPDVPLNLHTYTQAAVIDVLSAAFCVMTGIDPVDPQHGCLGIDSQTHKLGFSSSSQDNQPQLGGVVGVIPYAFEMVYTPPASSLDYISYVKDNFGIIKPAYAQASYNGFSALSPLLSLWKISLNISYFFFVLVFITIGLAIMLRVHIDPRTVMTIQNQIPRIIVCLLLTTFSFAISGLMVDSMWLLLYSGINLITQDVKGDADATKCSENVRIQANENIMRNPFVFVQHVVGCTNTKATGLTSMTHGVADVIGNLIGATVDNLLGGQGKHCSIDNIVKCFEQGVVTIIQWTAFAISWLIVILALIFAIFRTWWSLLKAYVLLIIYVITAPLIIMLGLLPSKPLGFEKWLRRMFVVLVIFPATALLICGASLVAGLYARTGGAANHFFAAPFVGYPLPSNFGWFIAFGMIMMMPQLLEILQDNLGATSKSGSMAIKSIAAGTAQGGSFAGGVGGGAWKVATRRDPYTGANLGPLAKLGATRPIARILKPILGPLTGWSPESHTPRPRPPGGH